MRSYARIRGAEREGAAAVEFALVGPVFFLLLVGMVVYGAWFWMARGRRSRGWMRPSGNNLHERWSRRS